VREGFDVERLPIDANGRVTADRELGELAGETECPGFVGDDLPGNAVRQRRLGSVFRRQQAGDADPVPGDSRRFDLNGALVSRLRSNVTEPSDVVGFRHRARGSRPGESRSADCSERSKYVSSRKVRVSFAHPIETYNTQFLNISFLHMLVGVKR